MVLQNGGTVPPCVHRGPLQHTTVVFTKMYTMALFIIKRNKQKRVTIHSQPAIDITGVPSNLDKSVNV